MSNATIRRSVVGPLVLVALTVTVWTAVAQAGPTPTPAYFDESETAPINTEFVIGDRVRCTTQHRRGRPGGSGCDKFSAVHDHASQQPEVIRLVVGRVIDFRCAALRHSRFSLYFG